MRILVSIVVALALAAWLVLRHDPERAADSVLVPATPSASPEVPALELVAPAVIEESDASPSEVRRKVEPARAVVAGRVVVDGGLPVTVDARVVAHAHRRGVSRLNSLRVEAPVARDGSFSFEVPAESSSVTLDLDAELLLLEEDVEVRPGRRDVELRPRVLALVRGRVHPGMGLGTDAIANARITLSNASIDDGSTSHATSYANSDDNGSFSLPCSEMDRELDLRGMASIGPAEGRMTIEPLHPGEIREVDLFLEPWIAPHGVAVDPEGHPIEGALVNVLVDPALRLDSSALRSVVTDADGRFQLEPLAPGTWEIEVVAPDRDRGHKMVELPREGLDELRFVLSAACVVRGRVLGVDGAPCAAVVSSDDELDSRSITILSGGVVQIGSSTSEGADTTNRVNQARLLRTRSHRVVTDAEGRFELSADSGSVRLVARARGFASSAPLELDLESGEHREDVVLRLRQACAVRGHVVDEEGKAVSLPLWFEARDGSHVFLMPDANGSFESNELPAGPGRLLPLGISHARYAGSLEIEPTPGIELDVELRVTRNR